MSGYDISIHCNCLDCRKIICHEQKACVTSCSHIFCLECSNVKFVEALVCPACESTLSQSNDIVLVELSPSEEYKSSILAGLSPTVIIDICNRALSFYNYQVSQELCYRKAVQQSLESQLGSKQDRLEAIIRDHKRIVHGEMKKMQALTKENEFEKRRNHDLQAEIQVKSNQFSKLQAMYDKLKRKTTGSMIQQSVQGHLTTIHPVTNDKHQSPYQATQSSKSYVQPLYPQHQSPTDFIRNVVDPTRHDTNTHLYQPQTNRQQRNAARSATPSPLYASHRVPPPQPLRNEMGTDHGPVLDQQQHQRRHHYHHQQQQQQQQQPLQNHVWKQFPPPPPPPKPSRAFFSADGQISPAPNRQFPLS